MISEEKKELYRAMVIGPTGSVKSQFCNFIQKDFTNSKNIVSDSLESCTKDPNSNFFKRGHSNYEFIDTAGSADTAFDDIKNLEKLIKFVKEKESLDFIFLLLNFSERLNNDTRTYLATLGKIFTAYEFYTHLSVVFTHFPTKPSKKVLKIKEDRIKEINDILKKIFITSENDALFQELKNINVYFIDTEINEDDNTYDEKSQETIDLMLESMKLDIFEFKSINTTNLDVNGENCKLRRDNEKKEIERLKKLLEESKLKHEKDENEILKLNEDINNLKLKNDEESKRRQIVLENQYRQIQIERKRNENLYNQNIIIAQQLEEKRAKISEEAQKKGIEIDNLNRKINGGLKTFGFFGYTGLNCVAWPLLIEGLVGLKGFGLYVGAGSLYTGGIGLVIAAIGLGVAGIYKIKKSMNENK